MAGLGFVRQKTVLSYRWRGGQFVLLENPLKRPLELLVPSNRVSGRLSSRFRVLKVESVCGDYMKTPWQGVWDGYPVLSVP